MTATQLDQLGKALDATGQLVAAVGEGQWEAPTPCTEWNVRHLVSHLVVGNHLFAQVLEGDAPPLEEIRSRIGTDALGEDPVAAYRAGVDAVVAAFSRPGALEQMVTVPVGTVPGIVALHLRIVEALVHGWDLARAIGRQLEVDDQLVEQELAFTREKLDLPGNRRPFAPAQPVDDNASALDRLAALLGRTVPA